MNRIRMNSKVTCLIAVACLSSILPNTLRAQVTAPSTYTTGIQVQAEPPGTEFTDWAGIPVADMDSLDNPGGTPPFIDIANVQIANDDENIYIHVTTHAAATSFANLFIAFDLDQNVATGFDPFGVQVIGSEFGYQTDFPFGQATGVYNSGATITGGPFGNGGALIYPFWTEAGAPTGTEIEWAVPLNATINGTPAFADGTFDFAIWADSSLGDISQRISYTLAAPPAGLPGDFNKDNSVDAADYVMWRKTDGADLTYNDWVEHFGETNAGSGGGAGGGPVPEPTIASLTLIAVMAIGLRARRSRSAR